jgi:NTP pyrophosphatase (non-canonical NTP hydrolase)
MGFLVFLSIIYAVLLLGLPVTALTYFLMRLVLSSGTIDRFESRKDLEKKLSKLKKNHDKDKEKSVNKVKNPVARKWLDFGGGFYGLMAFFTYILIEVGEIADFVRSLSDLEKFISSLGFDLLIQFLINSILNFVYAMIWFITLQNVYYTSYPLLWLLIAYGSYLLGAWLARDYPTIEALSEGFEKLKTRLSSKGANVENAPNERK